MHPLNFVSLGKISGIYYTFSSFFFEADSILNNSLTVLLTLQLYLIHLFRVVNTIQSNACYLSRTDFGVL